MLNTTLFGSSYFCYMSEVNVCVRARLYTWFFQAKDFAKKALRNFVLAKPLEELGKKTFV